MKENESIALFMSLKTFTGTSKWMQWNKYKNLAKIFVFIVLTFPVKDSGKSIHLLSSSLVWSSHLANVIFCAIIGFLDPDLQII